VLETEFSKPKPKDVNATGVLLDPLHRSHMSMDDILAWLDRLESLRLYKQATLASTDDSLQEQISDYLETQRKRAKLGQIKMSTFKAYQERTEPFQNWLKINNRTQINTAVVRDYQTYIVEEISESRISEQWGCHLRKQANSVIHYLARNELCTLPANLNDPVLTIQVADKEITPLSDAEIKIILNNSPERTKLYALLMLNCGMLPTDIADLKQTEYNGTHITRKRSKTGKKKKGKKNQVPTVSWKLWNSTRQLLDKYRSDHAEYLLLNQGGQPLMKKAIRKDGKVSITSNIKSCWSRLQKKMKRKGIIVRPLEQLRKTGACKLEDNIAYARYSQFFLGQAPSGITEKRYAPPSKQIFDEAMTWLGQQFNL
jgi:integrase